MDGFDDALRLMLGLDAGQGEINALQMTARAALVYIVTLAVVRIGKKRLLGRSTAFDVILGIMLGSIVSRAITGNAPFLPALCAGAALVGIHWLFSGIACRWHGFGVAIKGRPRMLVVDGAPDQAMLRKTHMTDRDLWEDLRSRGISRMEEVAEARLERSGQVSVIKAAGEPKTVEFEVADGVQTVRIELR